jgi:unsaturated rhamnogalacturonyl hydrolase
MIRAIRHFPDLKKDLSQVGTKAIAASLTYVDSSGVLTRTSAGTVLQLIPFGYSVIRSDRMQLWGQGLALNAISVMLEPDKNFVAINN